jgi:hypothetical protein
VRGGGTERGDVGADVESEAEDVLDNILAKEHSTFLQVYLLYLFSKSKIYIKI